jgi:ABC-type arginine transport system ATPase subunit
MEKLRIADYAKRYPAQLSGGSSSAWPWRECWR